MLVDITHPDYTRVFIDSLKQVFEFDTEQEAYDTGLDVLAFIIDAYNDSVDNLADCN